MNILKASIAILILSGCSLQPVVQAGSDVQIGRDWNCSDCYPEAKGGDSEAK